MTYCVGMRLNKGLVFMSDTRTNAGVDDISQVRKMRSWTVPGERVITLMSAGNLATTQAVVSLLDERTKAPAERNPSILEAPSMFQVATIIGETLRGVVMRHNDEGPAAESLFRASLIVGGQIKGAEPRLFLIYPEGNFIEAGEDTPYLQTGETKYGKPIIDRVITRLTPLAEAAKCVLVSFDSTMRSNLSVGMPIDLICYQRDSLEVQQRRRFDEGDAYFTALSREWSEGTRKVFRQLPELHW